jgi:hypothetical protein
MKINNNIKNVMLISGALFAGSLFFSSCIKNYLPQETNLTHLQPTADIPEGGLYQLGSETLSNDFASTDAVDTAWFHVNYAATGVAPANENFTLAIDTSASVIATADSAVSGSGIFFQVLPDSCYSFTSTQVTVNAGQMYTSQIPFVIYPAKINPNYAYMLPIAIVGAPSGVTISGNIGIVYWNWLY